MDEKTMSIEGKLERIFHRYNEKEFQNSLITIKKKDGTLKHKIFYGNVPETLLGKKITLIQTYKKEIAELSQYIEYSKNKRLRYSIHSCSSNIEEDNPELNLDK